MDSRDQSDARCDENNRDSHNSSTVALAGELNGDVTAVSKESHEQGNNTESAEWSWIGQISREGVPLTHRFLPPEFVKNVFSYLPMIDRMRARVCWALNEIEARAPCYFDEICLREDKTVDVDDKTRPFEFVWRVAPVTTVGELAIWVTDWSTFDVEYGSLIKDEIKKIHMLRLIDENSSNLHTIIDGRFLDLSHQCEVLDVDVIGSVTAEALYEAYQRSADGTMPLMGFYGARIGLEKRNAFLKLLGVTIIAGVVSSSRKNIEVFSKEDRTGIDYHIFDDGMELTVYSRNDSLTFVSPKLRESHHYKKHLENYNIVGNQREGLEKVDIKRTYF